MNAPKQTEAQRLRAALEALVGASEPAELQAMRAVTVAALAETDNAEAIDMLTVSRDALDVLLTDPIPDSPPLSPDVLSELRYLQGLLQRLRCPGDAETVGRIIATLYPAAPAPEASA